MANNDERPPSLTYESEHEITLFERWSKMIIRNETRGETFIFVVLAQISDSALERDDWIAGMETICKMKDVESLIENLDGKKYMKVLEVKITGDLMEFNSPLKMNMQVLQRGL
tara:strand:+ start:163 stop:501 length:339 start_codon:yes stop_codon:yes gene_type:complete